MGRIGKLPLFFGFLAYLCASNAMHSFIYSAALAHPPPEKSSKEKKQTPKKEKQKKKQPKPPHTVEKAKPQFLEIEEHRWHPTQFNVGMKEIEVRLSEVKAVMKNKKKLRTLLRRKPTQVIRGYNGGLYVVDGHHFMHGLLKLGIKEVYVEFVDDKEFSKITDEAEFWRKMVEKNYVYLKDKGIERPLDHLPVTFAELTDDPYRSLSWLVRKVGGFKNLELKYQEFFWADFLRDLVEIKWNNSSQLRKTIIQARDFAFQHPKAKSLPGHIDNRIDQLLCEYSFFPNPD